MSESPKTAAPAAAAAPPYTPSGAAASERMLSSVIGRVAGSFSAPIGRSLHFADRLVGGIVDGAGPVHGRAPAQRLFAQPVFGGPETPHAGPERPLTSEAKAGARRERIAPTQDLLTASPTPRRSADLRLPRSLRPAMALSSPERMFGNKTTGHDGRANHGSDDAHDRLAQPVLSTGWEPPVAHAALETGKNPDAQSPLWGQLPRPTLEPLLAAVEADLGKAEERRETPAMELLRGGAAEPPRQTTAPKGPISAITEEQAHRMAVESSKRLMDAVRAHAMAQSGSDDRISLGDMALISFADSTKQMAAAESYTSMAPDPQPTEKALGQMANPKVKEHQGDLHNKLRAMAKLVAEDLKQVQKLSKERFGHG